MKIRDGVERYHNLSWEQLTTGLRARLQRDYPRTAERLERCWVHRRRPALTGTALEPLRVAKDGSLYRRGYLT